MHIISNARVHTHLLNLDSNKFIAIVWICVKSLIYRCFLSSFSFSADCSLNNLHNLSDRVSHILNFADCVPVSHFSVPLNPVSCSKTQELDQTQFYLFIKLWQVCFRVCILLSVLALLFFKIYLLIIER